LALTDNGSDITRVNVLRALDPAEGYPRFNFAIALDGIPYELVLSNVIVDWLRVCCTGDEREQMDVLKAGGTPEDLRIVVVRRTSGDANRDRRMYGELELEALTHVHADRLIETVAYRYLFVSQGIANHLLQDAEHDKLPPDLAEYALQHRSVFRNCGGFELLTARYQWVDVHNYVKSDPTAPSQEGNGTTKVDERRAFLRSLL
jgi:hypothetical protein